MVSINRHITFTSWCLAALLFIVLFSGCIDEITFDSKRTTGQLVVNGGVYDHTGPFYLELAMTNEATAHPMPLGGADVFLVDENGNRERYNQLEPGRYKSEGNVVSGQRGIAYHIEITLPDGRFFHSIPEMIPLLNGQPEALVEPGFLQEPSASGRMRDVPHVFIRTNTTLPESNESLFFKWDVESVYMFRENEPQHPLAPPANNCYIQQRTDPQTISILSTSQIDSNIIENKPLVTKRIVPDEFYIRHVFNVILSSVSERRYNYWNHVDQIINRSGTIFDVPPATVRGNIINPDDPDDIILGYFEAAARDTAHISVTRADLPYHVPNPCPGTVGCMDCLMLENSSLDRPHYF